MLFYLKWIFFDNMGSSKLQSNESKENSILSGNQLDKTSIKPQKEPQKNLFLTTKI